MSAVAERTLPVWKEALVGAQERFVAIADKDHLVDWQRESMFALQAIEKGTYLKSVSEKNPASLRNAIINVAACGLTLNPAAQYAALVPRDGGVCLDIMYRGLIKIATDMGSIRWVQAEIVHESDTFSFNGRTVAPTHTANVFAKDRGPIVGVYCVAKTVDGDILTEVMSVDEVNAIRDRSSGWKAYDDGKAKSTPWATDWGEMAKKTVIKRARKTWPETMVKRGAERIQAATELANVADGYDQPIVDDDPQRINGASGVWERIDEPTREAIRKAAEKVKKRFAAYDVAGAYNATLEAPQGPEEQVALGTLLDSKQRTALVKERKFREDTMRGEAETAAAEALDRQALRQIEGRA